MRVKTVPRHMNVPSNSNIPSSSKSSLNSDNFLASNHKEEEEGVRSNFVETMSVSESRKSFDVSTSDPNAVAGPSSGCECVHKKYVEDEATNEGSEDKEKYYYRNAEVVDLSTRNHETEYEAQEEIASATPCTSSEQTEKLKDTFLYKIMTDPTFLESIQKNKQQAKKLTCPFCRDEFSTDGELNEHMEGQRDESTNQVICCACKKTFAQKRYLRYHQRCHSEKSKFTCDLCTRKYTRLDNLTRHNAFHLNPDKFACTFCEKTFARKDLLNKHLKCHENKYRFYCDGCVKYFKGPLTLDNHKKSYHSTNT